MTEPCLKHFPSLSSSHIWSYWEAEQRVGGMYCAGINASYSHYQTSSKCPQPFYSTFPTISPSFNLSAPPISDWLLSVLLCCVRSEECVRHLLCVLSGAVSSGTFRAPQSCGFCPRLNLYEIKPEQVSSPSDTKLHVTFVFWHKEIFHASGCKIVAEQNIVMVLTMIKIIGK